MIETIQNYDDLFRLVRDFEHMQDKGMTRFRLHGFQKHGDETMNLPDLEDGLYHLDEMAWRLEQVLDKALMLDYQLKFEKKKNKKEDESTL